MILSKSKDFDFEGGFRVSSTVDYSDVKKGGFEIDFVQEQL